MQSLKFTVAFHLTLIFTLDSTCSYIFALTLFEIIFQDVKKTTNFLNFIPGYIIIPLKFCAIMYIMLNVIGKAVYIAFPVSFVSYFVLLALYSDITSALSVR